MSGWLKDKAKVGDLLQIHGPHGRFVIREHVQASRCFFVATGTGIVPLASMIQSTDQALLGAIDEKTMIWGNRYCRDAYNIDYFREFFNERGIKFEIAFSQELNNLSNKYVTEFIPQQFYENDLIYAAGHPKMICDIRHITSVRGLRSDRIFSEAFSFAPVHLGK
jgi:ferredoxin-NADP reductase